MFHYAGLFLQSLSAQMCVYPYKFASFTRFASTLGAYGLLIN